MKSKNKLILATFLTIAPMLLLVVQAQAQDIGMNYAGDIGLPSNSDDPREAVVSIVRYLMTFLGLIAVLVIMLGGFKWMVAAGNEDKVAEAKKLIVAGLIGLVIILSAYVIVQVVVSTTLNVLSGT